MIAAPVPAGTVDFITSAWRSERGVHQQGRWTLTPHEDGTTEIQLEIGYDLAGGPIGRFVEMLVGRIVGGNMAATLLALRRVVEFEERPALSRLTP